MELSSLAEIMKKNGAEYALMSGSGPSVFGKFNDGEKAKDVCEKLLNDGYTAFVCHSFYPEVDK